MSASDETQDLPNIRRGTEPRLVRDVVNERRRCFKEGPSFLGRPVIFVALCCQRSGEGDDVLLVTEPTRRRLVDPNAGLGLRHQGTEHRRATYDRAQTFAEVGPDEPASLQRVR